MLKLMSDEKGWSGAEKHTSAAWALEGAGERSIGLHKACQSQAACNGSLVGRSQGSISSGCTSEIPYVEASYLLISWASVAGSS